MGKTSARHHPLHTTYLNFQEITDAVPAMVVVYNIRTGEYLYVNKASQKVLGYNPTILMKRGLDFVSQLVHPDDISKIVAENAAALAKANRVKRSPDNDPIINFEYRMKHKNGSWRWLHTDGSVFSRGQDGKVECVLNASLDITPRKKMEDTLRRLSLDQVEQHSLLLQTVSDAIIASDMNLKITNWNSAAEQLYGYKKAEVLGKNYFETVRTRTPRAMQRQIIAAVKKDGEVRREAIHVRRDGKPLIIFSTARLMKNAAGKPVGLIAANLDITARKRLERQKDDFIGVASHELKTPVTSIKAYTQLLNSRFQKAGDSKSAELVTKMDAQLNKLTSLIGDLLDATKIESGRLQLHETQFNFNHLVTEIVEDVQRTTTNHRFIIKLGKAVRLHGDKERLGQVLTNLLTNAIKYSPLSDKIIVTTTAQRGTVKVCVQDFGMGIKPEKQSRIFERFYRVSGPHGDTYPGLGLGLYISSEIMKQQGGKIWVTSTEGKGSSFYVSLPIARSKRRRPPHSLLESDHPSLSVLS